MVVMSAKPTKMVAYAARELTEHVERATGVRLSIVADGDGVDDALSRIYIVGTEAVRALGYAPDTLAPEAFVLCIEGPCLYVFGREEADAEPLRDNVPKGVLFGVYELLERYMGVRWMWPGELGIVILRYKTLTIEDNRDNEQVPRLCFRHIR